MKPKSVKPSVKPYTHQLASIKHNDGTDIVLDTSDAGTGKTGVRAWAFEKRRRKNGGCLLVLAPKSLLRSVWANDLKKFTPGLTVAVSTAGKHEAVFNEDADVYVTNLDAVKWLAKQKPAFFKKFSELVVDESTAYKHHSSQRSKAALKISKYFKYRCCMTATPNSNSITDVWHQVMLLDGGKRLGNSFYAFRSTVCTPVQVGRNEHAIQWGDKDGAEEAVFGLLSDITIRHELDKCADIPKLHQYNVPYYMSGTHRKAYDELMETAMLQIYGTYEERLAARMKGVKLKPKSAITAVHAGALAQKLLQLASGAVYESPEKYHVFDHGRYEMILDLVENRKHSLVFFFWKHQRDLLLAEAEKRGISFAMIDGSVGEKERNDIAAAYQRGAYQTLFAHPKTTAHGYTFTKGTATIWSSPTHDAEIFKQGSARQRRLGQTQKTENIIITAADSVDTGVYDNMLAKDARMTNLLDLFSTL